MSRGAYTRGSVPRGGTFAAGVSLSIPAVNWAVVAGTPEVSASAIINAPAIKQAFVVGTPIVGFGQFYAEPVTTSFVAATPTISAGGTVNLPAVMQTFAVSGFNFQRYVLLSDTADWTDVASATPESPILLTESLSLTESLYYRLAEIITDSLSLSPSISTVTAVSIALEDEFSFEEVLSILGVIPSTLAESTTLSATPAYELKDTISSSISLSSSATTLAEFIQELEDTFGLDTEGSTDSNVALTLSSNITLSEELYFRLAETISEALSLSDSISSLPDLIQLLTESFAFTDSQLLTLALTSSLSEIILFGTTITDDETTFDVWVMNTDSLALSQYDGVEFESYATTRKRTFGIKEDGLYEFFGDSDGEVEIEAYLRTGYMDFGSFAEKGVDRGFLYMKTGEPIYLKTAVDSWGKREEQVYVVSAPTNTGAPHARLLDLKKGIKAVAWAFEIRTIDGGDLDLLGFEVWPVTLRRPTGA